MMRIATLTLLLAALASGACFNPDLSGDPGPFKCTTDTPGSCPDNYECDLAQGKCVKKSATTHDASPGDQQMRDVIVHETAPDASPEDLAKDDAPAPPALTCTLGASPKFPQDLGRTIGGSTVGLAYDETTKALYASYVAPISTTKHRLIVRQATLDTGQVTVVLNRSGPWGTDTAVAAHKGQWVVVYQEESNQLPRTQTFKAIRSKNLNQTITLTTASAGAGKQPAVIFLPNDSGFVAAHALSPTKNDLKTPQGEAIHVSFASSPPGVKGRYLSPTPSTGFDNNLAVDTGGTVFYTMLAKKGIAITALITKSPFATSPPPRPQEIALGDFPASMSPNGPSIDTAWPRLVATAKPQSSPTTEIQYRPNANQTTNESVPFVDKTAPLVNLGRPRIAARDGMIAVSAIDAKKNLWITVQDADAKTKPKPWSPAFKVSIQTAIDRIVATPGSSKNEVIFQILYRDATTSRKLYLQTLTCKRNQ